VNEGLSMKVKLPRKGSLPFLHLRDRVRANSTTRCGPQERVREGQPAPGRVDRPPLQPRPHAAAGPDPGGQHRPDEGGRPLRPPQGLPLLDLRQLVDPSRDQPRDRRQGPRRAPAGAHDRRLQQGRARPPRVRGPARPRPDRRRARHRHRRQRAERLQRMRGSLVENPVSLDQPLSDDTGPHPPRRRRGHPPPSPRRAPGQRPPDGPASARCSTRSRRWRPTSCASAWASTTSRS
jgi:hypothetical protein